MELPCVLEDQEVSAVLLGVAMSRLLPAAKLCLYPILKGTWEPGRRLCWVGMGAQKASICSIGLLQMGC